MAVVRNKGRRLNEYIKDYIVFDIETTGFRPGLDEIIEISAVKVENSEIIDTYSTLVRPIDSNSCICHEGEWDYQ